MVKVLWTATLLLALAAYVDSSVGGLMNVWGGDRADLVLTLLILLFMTAVYGPFARRQIARVCLELAAGLGIAAGALESTARRIGH